MGTAAAVWARWVAAAAWVGSVGSGSGTGSVDSGGTGSLGSRLPGPGFLKTMLFSFPEVCVRATPRDTLKVNPQNLLLVALLNQLDPKISLVHSNSLILCPNTDTSLVSWIIDWISWIMPLLCVCTLVTSPNLSFSTRTWAHNS